MTLKAKHVALLAPLGCLLACRHVPGDSDLRQVRRAPDYALDELVKDLQTVRSAKWPDRGGEIHLALASIFERADWTGVGRVAALRMLGPVDGELEYREVEFVREFEAEGKKIKLVTPEKEPYLVEPKDDRLIYRTGDGYNHGAIYTLLFRNGRAWKVEISAGY